MLSTYLGGRGGGRCYLPTLGVIHAKSVVVERREDRNEPKGKHLERRRRTERERERGRERRGGEVSLVSFTT